MIYIFILQLSCQLADLLENDKVLIKVLVLCPLGCNYPQFRCSAAGDAPVTADYYRDGRARREAAIGQTHYQGPLIKSAAVFRRLMAELAPSENVHFNVLHFKHTFVFSFLLHKTFPLMCCA